ncbi:hypothetical protein DUNSADRAFT_16031 [Dunaliella salina]|uniref:Encoded protein n=1 Tax=Dunaliella salina TaxID=3046 RepID=A0ABQ7H1B9_DUNSA|nr:hypothetical protein DUNSADRAFT_16031 [Dunaliella salina]|eukprot:KAF5840658.1 hypothetical protein DUNSADRAFT_16031 [Dunaliella salina]
MLTHGQRVDEQVIVAEGHEAQWENRRASALLQPCLPASDELNHHSQDTQARQQEEVE